MHNMVAYCVAPFTGAWIEIGIVYLLATDDAVAPFTGAWIEIMMLGNFLLLVL